MYIPYITYYTCIRNTNFWLILLKFINVSKPYFCKWNFHLLLEVALWLIKYVWTYKLKRKWFIKILLWNRRKFQLEMIKWYSNPVRNYCYRVSFNAVQTSEWYFFSEPIYGSNFSANRTTASLFHWMNEQNINWLFERA